MRKFENAERATYQKHLEMLDISSTGGRSDSSLQMNKDLFDQKKLNAERESMLYPGTFAKDKYGEYGYAAGEGIDSYEKAAKDDPDLGYFEVDKNIQ